jgi:hypothetical protein
MINRCFCPFSIGELTKSEAEFLLLCLGFWTVVEHVAFAGEIDFHALFDGVRRCEVSIDGCKPAWALAFSVDPTKDSALTLC